MCETGLITLTRDEYNEIMEDLHLLRALRSAGVDNWDGYDYALEILDGNE